MWVILVLKILLLERDGVVEEELRSVFETIRDCISGEVPMEGAQDIGEHEGNIMGQGLWEDGG
jgi:hypothetical protein